MKKVSFTFDGKSFSGDEGQSIAAALISHGVTSLRSTRFNEEPRMIFCGIGSCYDCVVTVNNIANQRACITLIAEGIDVEGMKSEKSR